MPEEVYFVPKEVYFVPEEVYFCPEKKYFVPEKKYFVPEKKYFVLEKKYFLPEKKLDFGLNFPSTWRHLPPPASILSHFFWPVTSKFGIRIRGICRP